MGLQLRVNLFYQQDAELVYDALSAFYQTRRQSFNISGCSSNRLDLYQSNAEWVLLRLDGGWHNWEIRQQACQQVSADLQCTSFSMFVYDGDYWGYTLFHVGEEIDRFLQDPEEANNWFPNQSSVGRAELVAKHLPYLELDDISPYLIRHPESQDDQIAGKGERSWWQTYKDMDVQPRPTDEFTRWDECSILNFQRLLGIQAELRDGYVHYLVPLWRSFWIKGIESVD